MIGSKALLILKLSVLYKFLYEDTIKCSFDILSFISVTVYKRKHPIHVYCTVDLHEVTFGRPLWV